MKLGFDNRREVIAMVILVVAALIFASRVLFFKGEAPLTATKAAPTATAGKASTAAPAAPAAARRRRMVLAGLRPSLDPSLRFDLLKNSEDREYEGGKRNIFQEHVEIVRAPAPAPTPAPTPPVDPGPPQPPPIPLKYYGFASKPGETRKVFLSNGDEVFVAEEGQIIQRRYKIVKITASSVEVEDVLNNQKQTLPLQQG